MAEKSKWTMDVENKQDFHCTDTGFNHAGNNKVINMFKTKQTKKNHQAVSSVQQLFFSNSHFHNAGLLMAP